MLAPAYVALSKHARKVLNNKFQNPLATDDFYDQDQINSVDQDFDEYNGIDGNENSDEVFDDAFNLIKNIMKYFYTHSKDQ